MTKINELVGDICQDAAVANGISVLLGVDAIPAAHSMEDAKNLADCLDQIIFKAAQVKELLKPFIMRDPRPRGEHLI